MKLTNLSWGLKSHNLADKFRGNAVIKSALVLRGGADEMRNEKFYGEDDDDTFEDEDKDEESGGDEDEW
ncbi:MAG: hypothetical protein NTV63_00345 [Candidatus Woesearchaeota archaeon]|nr:hypothetical protein [Candidatus Woesearchaeota archaeon]